MKKSYRITYIGDDSLEHRTVVWAKDRAEAAQEAKRVMETDIVVGVRRCMNPYVKTAAWVLSILIFLVLLIASVR